MFKLFRNKRGISPLVATIFLMAFAVGLGAVVMQFSEGLIGGDDGSACSAEFQLSIVKLCSRPNSLEFEAKNTGEVEISGIKVLTEDIEGEGKLKKFSDIIGQGSKIGKKIKHEGNLQAIQFIPLVREGKAEDAKTVDCNSRARTFNKDEVESC